MSRISRRGVWFAGILLLLFWSLASHPNWVETASAPSGMIVYLAFVYRWLFPEKITTRGIWFSAAIFICWYFAFYTEWTNNNWALAGMIVFLFFFHGLLWPEEIIPLERRRQRGTVEIISECSFRRVSERTVDQPLRQRIAAQPSAGAARE